MSNEEPKKPKDKEMLDEEDTQQNDNLPSQSKVTDLQECRQNVKWIEEEKKNAISKLTSNSKKKRFDLYEKDSSSPSIVTLRPNKTMKFNKITPSSNPGLYPPSTEDEMADLFNELQDLRIGDIRNFKYIQSCFLPENLRPNSEPKYYDEPEFLSLEKAKETFDCWYQNIKELKTLVAKHDQLNPLRKKDETIVETATRLIEDEDSLAKDLCKISDILHELIGIVRKNSSPQRFSMPMSTKEENIRQKTIAVVLPRLTNFLCNYLNWKCYSINSLKIVLKFRDQLFKVVGDPSHASVHFLSEKDAEFLICLLINVSRGFLDSIEATLRCKPFLKAYPSPIVVNFEPHEILIKEEVEHFFKEIVLSSKLFNASLVKIEKEFRMTNKISIMKKAFEQLEVELVENVELNGMVGLGNKIYISKHILRGIISKSYENKIEKTFKVTEPEEGIDQQAKRIGKAQLMLKKAKTKYLHLLIHEGLHSALRNAEDNFLKITPPSLTNKSLDPNLEESLIGYLEGGRRFEYLLFGYWDIAPEYYYTF